MEPVPAEHDSGAEKFEAILVNALKVPGVKVNRSSFLAETFQNVSAEKLNLILSDGPISAGYTQSELDRLSSSIIIKRTVQSTGVSFAAGLPGGLAMAATIPADTMQFFCMALRLAQEITYLYGAEDLWDNSEIDNERVMGQFVLYFGVMFGVSGSAAAVKLLSSTLAKQVAKKLPQKALTKTLYYPIIKKVASTLGVKLTKDTFAKGISKFIPIIGGVVSGGITFASMKPMGTRLAHTLSEANFNYTAEQAEHDLAFLYKEDEIKPERDTEQTPTGNNIADTLIKYQGLMNSGLITREEFELLKSRAFQEGE